MKYLYCLIALFVSLNSFAQKQIVRFMRNTGEYVSRKDSADFIRIVKQAAGEKLYTVLDFYTDGKGKMEAFSTWEDPVRLEGTCRTFYHNGNRKEVSVYQRNNIIGEQYTYFPNGNLYTLKIYSNPDSLGPDKKRVPQSVIIQTCNDSTGKNLVVNGTGHYIGYDKEMNYVFEEGDLNDGKPIGEWTGYDRDFKLKFKESYQNGLLTTGTATDTAGKQISYTQRKVSAGYPKGIDAFYSYLGRTVRYPSRDRENNIQGTVIIKFVVKKEGGLKDFEIYRSASPTIDAEALRVVKLSGDLWIPGYYLGKPVNQLYTVPISFSLAHN